MPHMGDVEDLLGKAAGYTVDFAHMIMCEEIPEELAIRLTEEHRKNLVKAVKLFHDLEKLISEI